MLFILAADKSKRSSILRNRCSVALRTEGDIVVGWGEVDEQDVDRVLGVDCEKDGEGARFWGGVTIF